MLNWESFVAAAFAPLVLWILWRIQALAVDKGLRRAMYRLLRYQKRTYNVVSWNGVLLHELSHALLLLLGGHGIRQFKVTTDSGHVTPSQIRRGPVGQLTFLAAALAPLYIAPGLLLLVAWLLLAPGLVAIANAGLGLRPAVDVLQATATDLAPALARAVVGLDVTTWAGAGFLALVIFALPAARPSFSKGKGDEKDQGDIAVVRRKIKQNPWPTLGLLALLYGAYFVLVPWNPSWYWAGWQIMWAVSLTCILLAVLAAIGWWGVAWTGRIKPWAAWLPYAWVIGAQWLGRMPLEQSVWLINLASLAGFALLAAVLLAVAPRRW